MIAPEYLWVLIRIVFFFFISLWIGGIFFLFGVAAPAVHRSMASKVIAGEIVSGMLKRFHTVELTCCLFMLSSLILSVRFVSADRGCLGWLTAGVFCMGCLTCLYAFRLASSMDRLKETVPSLASLQDSHPDKSLFIRLHRAYVRLMAFNAFLGIAVLSAAVVLLL